MFSEINNEQNDFDVVNENNIKIEENRSDKIEKKEKIFFENEVIEFKKEDAIFILPNEKYYWDSNYCIVSLTCTPAWSEEQHLLIS